jgi:bifunctional non-homologous end joining protein LigD
MNVRAGRRRIEVSNADKPFFPEVGLTKGDLVAYYAEMADVMYPFLRGRAMTLRRFPDGVEGEGFYQQNRPDYFPDWIGAETMRKASGKEVTHVVCRDKATMPYLANQGVITPHIWLSRADNPDFPDRFIIDLDPPGEDFDPVRRAALAVREMMEGIGLVPFAMTTGSSGLHVIMPIRVRHDFDTVRAFARRVADLLAAEHPDELTTEQRKEKRAGRIYLDTGRNAYGQTAVAPYAVRARPRAPVATPVDWAEVARSDLHPQKWTIATIRQRLAQKEDPWATMGSSARSLNTPMKRLRRP